jgi:DNA-binding CsgD family transcriptional regulator
MCFLAPILDSYKTTLFPKLSALTSAEIAVIRLAIRGFTYKEIASALAKSTNTIDNQLRSARAKLRVRNQVELVQACSGLLCR